MAAQSLDNVPESLRACIAEKEDALRLACYDRELANLASTPTGTPSSAADEESVAAADAPSVAAAGVSRQTEEESFGMPAERPDPDEQLMEITATVTKLQNRSGIVTVWLDNGHVWQQKYSGMFLIKEGDTVTVKQKSFLGGYRLENRGRRTEVKRIK